MALKKSFPAPTGAALSSIDNRANLIGMVSRTTNNIPRAGILPRHVNVIGQSTTSMAVIISSFEAVLVRVASGISVPSFISNDGSMTVPIGSAPAANSRYDIVYVKQNESQSPFADANDLPILAFVSGAAAAIPDKAAALSLVPAGALPLVAVLIPSGSTSTQSAGVVVTQEFNYTALSGSPIWIRNAAERADMGSYAQGQQIFRLDTGRTEQFFSLYNASLNPTGSAIAGWYPISGKLPACMLRKSSGQNTNVNAGQPMPIIWQTNELNNGGLSSAQPSRYSPGQMGIYQVDARTRISVPNGVVYMNIMVNGTPVSETRMDGDPVGGSLNLSHIVRLTSDTDYIEINSLSFSSAVAISTSPYSGLDVAYIGPL